MSIMQQAKGRFVCFCNALSKPYFCSMNWRMNEADTQELTQIITDEKEVADHELVLFNDEVNTFDWVIVSLMEVCQHTLEQAEQCALITHHKGKCGVKSGSWDDLKPRCENLLERGLSAEII